MGIAELEVTAAIPLDGDVLFLAASIDPIDFPLKNAITYKVLKINTFSTEFTLINSSFVSSPFLIGLTASSAP